MKISANSANNDISLKDVFFHGCDNEQDVVQLAKEGFSREVYDEDGRYFRDGNLGIGIYITTDWKTAVWFGNFLLKLSLEPGTRIVDTSIKPDRKVLDYLRKEFGADILKPVNPRKIIPRNKKLTEHELVELTRHHYCLTFEKDWGVDNEGFSRWPQKRCQHSDALYACVSLLKRYNFHGYGNPEDDNGIIIFEPKRIRLIGVIAEVPMKDHYEMLSSDNLESTNFSLREFTESFPVSQILKSRLDTE